MSDKGTFTVPVYFPRPISPRSWLHEPRFLWFREALAYAETQNRAIPALAKCEPEEIYGVVVSVMRGAKIPIPDEAGA